VVAISAIRLQCYDNKIGHQRRFLGVQWISAGQLARKIKKLEKGDQLSTEQRTQMKKLVEDMYESQVKALMKDPYITSRANDAKRNQIDIEDTIIGELGSFVRGLLDDAGYVFRDAKITEGAQGAIDVKL